MIIDFHMHAFVDALAPRAIDKLSNTSGDKPNTNGTVSDTREKLAQWGVTHGVLLPIATKASHQRTINEWAASVNGGGIISFGTVYPYADDAVEQLEYLHGLGLRGIKLHPDYQQFAPDDAQFTPLFKRCEELGLVAVLHMGWDAVSPEHTHAPPIAAKNLIERHPALKLVGAHLGGFAQWDAVEEHLVGTNVYLDTAYIAGAIDPVQLKRIIDNHGADKILFASDCPWHKSTDEIALIDSLGLTETQRRQIYYDNAAALLGL